MGNTQSGKKDKEITFLIIDPQNDFANEETGSLYVPNAVEDSMKTAELIRERKADLDRIVISLDSHHKLHIAHPTFWQDKNGKNPDPFTTILSQDIKDGTWEPTDEAVADATEGNHIDWDVAGEEMKKECVDEDGNLDLVSYCVQYSKALEDGGKFKLCIWPEHCLIGGEGNDVVKVLQDALDEWEVFSGSKVEYVRKGQNNLTEMYSAIRAEVPLTKETSYNTELFDSLDTSKLLLVAGEAKSHCVNYTVRDLMEKMDKKERVYLLSDCASPVIGFGKDAEEFEKYVAENGGNVIKSDEVETLLQKAVKC